MKPFSGSPPAWAAAAHHHRAADSRPDGGLLTEGLQPKMHEVLIPILDVVLDPGTGPEKLHREACHGHFCCLDQINSGSPEPYRAGAGSLPGGQSSCRPVATILSAASGKGRCKVRDS